MLANGRRDLIRRLNVNSKFFFFKKEICIFDDICTLIELAGQQQEHSEWRLFIDVSNLAYKL